MGPVVEEVDPRAQFRTVGADSEEANSGGVDHPLTASWCLSQDWWA